MSLPDEKRLKKNDVFICMSSGSKDHIGKVAFIDQDTNYYAGGFMGIIRVNNQRCLPKYLYYCLNYSPKYRKEIKFLTQGANINNISSTINSIMIPLPVMDIQKRMNVIHSCMCRPLRKWYSQILVSFCKGEYEGYTEPGDFITEQMIQSFKLSTNELLVCNDMSVSNLITEHRGYATKLKAFKKAVTGYCQEMGYIA